MLPPWPISRRNPCCWFPSTTMREAGRATRQCSAPLRSRSSPRAGTPLPPAAFARNCSVPAPPFSRSAPHFFLSSVLLLRRAFHRGRRAGGPRRRRRLRRGGGLGRRRKRRRRGLEAPLAAGTRASLNTPAAAVWAPVRACLRYVTQRPWNRIPPITRTLIFNPVLACLAGGRNKVNK